MAHSKLQRTKNILTGAVLLVLTLLPQASFLAPQVSATSPTEVGSYTPPTWTSQAPTPAQYLGAKYVYAYLKCFAADPYEDEAGFGKTRAVRREISDPNTLNLFQSIDGSDGDRIVVGYDIAKNDEGGAAECDGVEGGADGYIKAFWGNIKDFAAQFYYVDDEKKVLGFGSDSFDNASTLLNTTFFKFIADNTGDFGAASLAPAFAKCFKEKGTSPTDSLTDYAPRDPKPSDNLVAAIVSGPSADDGDNTADREGMTNCEDFLDFNSDVGKHSRDIVKLLADAEFTTDAVLNDTRALYDIVKDRAQEAADTTLRETATAALLTALSGNVPQVNSCLAEVGNPSVEIQNMTARDLIFTDATGKEITLAPYGAAGDKAVQTGDEAKLRMVYYLQNAAPETWVSSIADWLADPDTASEYGFVITPGRGGYSPGGGIAEIITIPPSSLDALNGCLVKNVPGVREALTELGRDLAALDEAYADVVTSEPAEEAADDCLAQDDFLSWFVCPVIDLIDSALETIESRIQEMLVFNLDTSGSKQGLQDSWNIFRSLATIIITVGFLLALVIKAIRGE